MGIRQKIEYLLDLGFDRRFFRLLLKQETISESNKAYVERLYGIVAENNVVENIEGTPKKINDIVENVKDYYR